MWMPAKPNKHDHTFESPKTTVKAQLTWQAACFTFIVCDSCAGESNKQKTAKSLIHGNK